jgi:LemA protein
VTESHPELRSSQNVLHFQEELGSTENRIAFARQFYNDAVLSYNTACQSFPGALVAGRLGFQPAQTFNLDDCTPATNLAKRPSPDTRCSRARDGELVSDRRRRFPPAR